MQRNKQKVAVRGEGERDHANAFLDLTDKENVDFVVSSPSFAGIWRACGLIVRG
jgi:hypothetical protein